jgi:hypothetical protein
VQRAIQTMAMMVEIIVVQKKTIKKRAEIEVRGNLHAAGKFFLI